MPMGAKGFTNGGKVGYWCKPPQLQQWQRIWDSIVTRPLPFQGHLPAVGLLNRFGVGVSCRWCTGDGFSLVSIKEGIYRPRMVQDYAATCLCESDEYFGERSWGP